MNLPWDKQYLKIAFHVVFTLVVVYCLVLFVRNLLPIGTVVGSMLARILSLFTPLFIALVIAYLLDPIVCIYDKKLVKIKGKWAQKRKKHPSKNDKKQEFESRAAATLLTYITVLLLLILGFWLIYRNIGSHKNMKNLNDAAANINAYIQGFNEMLFQIQIRLAQAGFLEQGEQLIREAVMQITTFVQNVGFKIVGIITKAGGQVINFVLGVVIGFYLLKDKTFFICRWNQCINALLPPTQAKKIRWIWQDIDHVLSGYIRGELIDSLIMATLISIVLTIIGIDFPIIIGIVAGIANLIPYFGSVVGVGAAVTVGLLSDQPIRALFALIALMLLQQIDGAIIVPKVIGESVDLHPVFVLLSIVIAGSLFGIPGMILAVPVTAMCKLLLLRYMERQRRMKEM